MLLLRFSAMHAFSSPEVVRMRIKLHAAKCPRGRESSIWMVLVLSQG